MQGARHGRKNHHTVTGSSPVGSGPPAEGAGHPPRGRHGHCPSPVGTLPVRFARQGHGPRDVGRRDREHDLAGLRAGGSRNGCGDSARPEAHGIQDRQPRDRAASSGGADHHHRARPAQTHAGENRLQVPSLEAHRGHGQPAEPAGGPHDHGAYGGPGSGARNPRHALRRPAYMAVLPHEHGSPFRRDLRARRLLRHAWGAAARPARARRREGAARMDGRGGGDRPGLR